MFIEIFTNVNLLDNYNKKLGQQIIECKDKTEEIDNLSSITARYVWFKDFGRTSKKRRRRRRTRRRISRGGGNNLSRPIMTGKRNTSYNG